MVPHHNSYLCSPPYIGSLMKMKEIIENSPPSILSVLSLYFKLRFKIRDIHMTRRASISCSQVYECNPDEIDYLIGDGELFSLRDTGKIVSGDWDEEPREISDYNIYVSLKQRYENNIDWEDTKKYNICIDKIKRGESCWHGCKTKEDLDQRCHELDQLYKNIREGGFKRQNRIKRNTEFDYIYPSYAREVSIAIGSDGELILIDGRHRLSMAKILELDSIPVHIAVVHEHWCDGIPDSIEISSCK